MKRLAFRLLKYVAPSLAGIVSDAYIGLRGVRLAELEADLDLLQSRLEEPPQPNQLALEKSLARISTGQRNSGGIAVIAPVQPTGTGIEQFTRSTYRFAPCLVDIYSPHKSFGDYLENTQDPLFAESNVRVFELSALPWGRKQNTYIAEIYVLGNSNQYWPIYRSLRCTASFPTGAQIWIHVHDPSLVNVLAVALGSQHNLRRAIETSYPDRVRGVDLWRAHRDPSVLTERGIGGIHALLHGIPIERIVVNSKSIGDLLRIDDPSLSSEQLLQLFLPVLPGHASPDLSRNVRPVIGAIGFEAGPKSTNLMIEAVRLLKQRAPDTMLVVAAAGAGTCAAHGQPFVRMADHRCLDALIEDMGTMNLIVYQPSGDLGERQRMVTRLLSNNSSLIVTGLEGLQEYGDAVRYIPPNISPNDLAGAMLEELESRDQRRHAIQQYAAAHGPKEFCHQLVTALMDPLEHRSKSSSLQSCTVHE